MLVTFKSASHGDITMFGNVAKSLLRMMGLSGDVPGAITADDIAAAREKLIAALEVTGNTTPDVDAEELDNGSDNADAESPVAMSTRAIPLLAMLESAANNNDNIMWE